MSISNELKFGEKCLVSHIGEYWEERVYLGPTKSGRHYVMFADCEKSFREDNNIIGTAWAHAKPLTSDK